MLTLLAKFLWVVLFYGYLGWAKTM